MLRLFVFACVLGQLIDPKSTFVDAYARVSGEVDAARLDMALREDQITRVVLVAAPQDKTKGGVDAEELARVAARHPGRVAFVAGGGSLNAHVQRGPTEAATPARTRELLARAARILELGARGLGELEAGGNVPADHPLLRALAGLAAERKVPLVIRLDPTAADVAALERLLAHERRARIVWAYAGGDARGKWTADLAGRLLAAHPNLSIVLRMVVGAAPQNSPYTDGMGFKNAWKKILDRHSDRFVLGLDPEREDARLTHTFLQFLPEAVARKIASENAIRLYGK